MEFKEKLAIGPSNVVDTAGAAVKVANKYSYMANAKSETAGAADGAPAMKDLLRVAISVMLGGAGAAIEEAASECCCCATVQDCTA